MEHAEQEEVTPGEDLMREHGRRAARRCGALGAGSALVEVCAVNDDAPQPPGACAHGGQAPAGLKPCPARQSVRSSPMHPVVHGDAWPP
jgi:hypothetical protein